MKLKNPPADLSARRADGQKMKKLLILVGRPVCGEQALQGGGIEMSVLHADLLSLFPSTTKSIA